MAPAREVSPMEMPPPVFTYNKPSKAIFPDGIKTSGQWPPNYDQIQPYESFPAEVKGSTVWDGGDYAEHPERWIHHLSPDELRELSNVADAFMATDTPLTGISKVAPSHILLSLGHPNIMTVQFHIAHHVQVSECDEEGDP